MSFDFVRKWWPYLVSSVAGAMLIGTAAGVVSYDHVHEPSTSISVRPKAGVSSYLDYSKNRRVGELDPIQAKHLPNVKPARAALVMNAKTGRVIYDHDASQETKVASLAKLMTLYLSAQKLAKLRSTSHPDPVVKVAQSNQLRKLSYDKTGLGGFKFKRGHQYRAKELYQAALIESSNNAAIALGDWVAGSNRNFVHLMNRQAKIWGLNARFISSSGLENDDIQKYGLKLTGGKASGNQVSARDLAVISYHLLRDYPGVLSWSKLPSKKVDGQVLTNENGSLPGQPEAKPGLRVDGLKTGFTNRAGMCVVSTEKPKRGPRLIAVVLHANGGKDFQIADKLLSWGNGELDPKPKRQQKPRTKTVRKRGVQHAR